MLRNGGVSRSPEAPRGSRKHFGSLVLGVYEKGKLVYAGHSGGGFSTEMVATLHARMVKLKTGKQPFTDVPHEDRTTWINVPNDGQQDRLDGLGERIMAREPGARC
jgi:hypothetical protein